jgi:hypothetical protein
MLIRRNERYKLSISNIKERTSLPIDHMNTKKDNKGILCPQILCPSL